MVCVLPPRTDLEGGETTLSFEVCCCCGNRALCSSRLRVAQITENGAQVTTNGLTFTYVDAIVQRVRLTVKTAS